MTDEEAAHLRLDAETTPGTATSAPHIYRWPEREMAFAYSSQSAVVQWRMRSACQQCGAPLKASGEARIDEPFTQTVRCEQCGASYTVDGMIAS